jgi:antitoxin (DNA-binding transcriptional repressor) of toxin-antitoxin stability system
MTTVTMLEMRKDPVRIIRQVRTGRAMLLTYRGKPVMRLEPFVQKMAPEEDAFYRLADNAVQGGTTLTNSEMDETIYDARSLR